MPSPTPNNLYNDKVCSSNLRENSASICNLTSITWDSINNQLLSLYNFGNYVNLVAYNSDTGMASPNNIFPALPELPFIPGGFYGHPSANGYLPTAPYGTPYSPTQLIVSGHTIYYMGLSGTIYSLQY